MDHERLVDGRGAVLRRALGATAALALEDSYRARLKCGRLTARVFFEADDWIRVLLSVDGAAAARPGLEALQLNRDLAGNARFSGSSRDRVVLADTMLNGADHLPESFDEIRESLQRATASRSKTCRERSRVDAERVQEALTELPWGEDGVVELEDSWELRPPMDGAPTVVRMTAKDDGLRLRHGVLQSLPDGDSDAAVVEQSLRFNTELRLSRLACDGDELVAESLLHGGQVEAKWIAVAARAVAASYRHCQPRLTLLSEDPGVARCYADFLLTVPLITFERSSPMTSAATLNISDVSRQKKLTMDLSDQLSPENSVEQVMDHYLTTKRIPRNGLRWVAVSRGRRLDKKLRIAELEEEDTNWRVLPEAIAGTR